MGTRRVRQHSAVGATFFLFAVPLFRLSAQSDLDRLTLRITSMTAVTGLEQAMTDSLLALLPGSTRDRTGNVTLTLGQGAPKRLLQCPLDEVGYVVGNITGEGYLLLRRVGARTTYPLFDQQLGTRERESATRAVRGQQDRECAYALHRYGGRDRGAGRRQQAGARDGAMDGGEMRADRRTGGRAVGLVAAMLLSASPSVCLSAQDSARVSEAQAVLAPLVESYGVSSAEGPVREAVKRLLPTWAKSETDTAGNLWVRLGQGNPLVVFVAHMDE